MESNSKKRAYHSILKHKVFHEFINRMIFKYRIALKSKMFKDSQTDYSILLLRELEKKTIQKKKQQKSSVNRRLKKSISINKKRIETEPEDLNFKDENLIFYILKELPGFYRYTKFNMISDDNLKAAIPYFKHVHLQKGQYLYDECDFATAFYGIIKGKICVISRKIKNSYMEMRRKALVYFDILEYVEKKKYEFARYNDSLRNVNNFDSIDVNKNSNTILMTENTLMANLNLIKSETNLKNTNNEIKLYNKEGECFGDWEIINTNSKTNFAFASEDSDLLLLEKDYFMDFFSKHIIKSENERKLFIKKIIQPLTNQGFDDFYARISPIFLEQHEVIYLQGSPGEFIYLVFSGSCLLQKCVAKGIQGKKDSEYDIASKKQKFYDILHISKGGIAGLESIYLMEHKYQYTMKAEENHTILFRIKSDEIIKNQRVRDYLKNIYNEQNKILNEYLQKHLEIKKTYKLSYINNDILLNKNKIIEGKVKNFVNESIKKNRNSYIARGNNEMRVNSCKLRLNEQKVTEIENINSANHNFIPTKDLFKWNYHNSTITKTFTENPVILRSPNKSKSKINELVKSQSSYNSNFNDNFSNLDLKASQSINSFKKGFSENFRLKSTSSIKKSNGNIQPKFINFKKKTNFIIYEEEKNIARPNSVVCKYRINPQISQTAHKWVEYKKKLTSKYSTGHFSLPLVTKKIDYHS